MFSKLFTLVAIVAGVSAAPLPRRSGSKSFDLWGGHQSLSGFDNFYGSDNFSGTLQQVNVVPGHEFVCQAKQIEVVQQRLLVIQEWAKKIITEVVCDVETQVLVFEQFHGSLGHFSEDLTRDSGRQVGYDYKIAEHLPKLWGDSWDTWGWSGLDYGKNYVAPSGHNWKADTSPQSVHDAWTASHEFKGEYKPEWAPEYAPETYVAPEHIPETYYAPEHVAETYSAEHVAETYAPEYVAETYSAEHVAETYAPEYVAESYAPVHEASSTYESYVAEHTPVYESSYVPEYVPETYSAAPEYTPSPSYYEAPAASTTAVHY